jgi:hypothetical protein
MLMLMNCVHFFICKCYGIVKKLTESCFREKNLFVLAGHLKRLHLIGMAQGTSLKGFLPQRRKQNPPEDVQFVAGRLAKGRNLHIGVKNVKWDCA